MTRVVVYTKHAAAAKITLDLESPNFKPLGGGDGVPPGMTVLDGENVVVSVAAQDFGVVVVEDGKATVEANNAAAV